jgi:hypothetical protein
MQTIATCGVLQGSVMKPILHAAIAYWGAYTLAREQFRRWLSAVQWRRYGLAMSGPLDGPWTNQGGPVSNIYAKLYVFCKHSMSTNIHLSVWSEDSNVLSALNSGSGRMRCCTYVE